jgi:hypothetical protein
MSDPIPGNDPNAAYDVVPSARWPKEWLTREKYSENYSQQPHLQGFSAADEIEELLRIARADEWPAAPRRAVWTAAAVSRFGIVPPERKPNATRPILNIARAWS